MERLYHFQYFSLFMHYLVKPFGIPIVQQWTFTIISLNLCNCSTGRNALRTALQCFQMLWNVMEDGKWAFRRKLSFNGGNFIMVSNLINNLLGSRNGWLCPSLWSLRSLRNMNCKKSCKSVIFHFNEFLIFCKWIREKEIDARTIFFCRE